MTQIDNIIDRYQAAIKASEKTPEHLAAIREFYKTAKQTFSRARANGNFTFEFPSTPINWKRLIDNQY